MPYTPDGKGHRALERLERSPATMGQLRASVRPSNYRKFWYVIVKMVADRLVENRAGVYHLLPRGAEELDELRNAAVGAPNIRRFTDDQGADGPNGPARFVA